ncbi:MAG: DUF4469 domain-containing protein [Prevotellaceae bacterium]|jgi:hypothetical protein|nr:DUF4469 domain-containing protein [Prevotellaceae bacterium]
MIQYVLEKNLLTEDQPNDFRARPVNVRSMTEDDLADEIADANVGISKAEALALLEAQAMIEKRWIAAGHAINLRLVHLHPSIPGNYERGHHPTNAVIRVTPSKEVTELAKTIPLQVVEAGSVIRVDSVFDVKTGTMDEKVTRGGTLKIAGHHLKIVGGTHGPGSIVFVSRTTVGTEYVVPAVDIVTNNPSELIVVIPATMVADEKVVIRITTYYSGTIAAPLKTAHTMTYEQELTVV